MILLAEVLLPEVVRVAPPVAPLVHLGRRHVDVLEVLVLVVAEVEETPGYAAYRKSFFTVFRCSPLSMRRSLRKGEGDGHGREGEY